MTSIFWKFPSISIFWNKDTRIQAFLLPEHDHRHGSLCGFRRLSRFLSPIKQSPTFAFLSLATKQYTHPIAKSTAGSFSSSHLLIYQSKHLGFINRRPAFLKHCHQARHDYSPNHLSYGAHFQKTVSDSKHCTSEVKISYWIPSRGTTIAKAAVRASQTFF